MSSILVKPAPSKKKMEEGRNEIKCIISAKFEQIEFYY